MAYINIRLSICEWDIGGKSDTTSYNENYEITEVGEVLYANKRETKRYAFKVLAISSDEIVLDCECPPAIIHLRKGEPYSHCYSFEGYEDHDGCVWNGEDENIYVVWQQVTNCDIHDEIGKKRRKSFEGSRKNCKFVIAKIL